MALSPHIAQTFGHIFTAPKNGSDGVAITTISLPSEHEGEGELALDCEHSLDSDSFSKLKKFFI